jgi:ribonuclease HI
MKKITVYVDGGSRGNPGLAAIGVVFTNEKSQLIKEYSEFLGEATNNEAEYQAAIFALEKFKALFGKKLAESGIVEVRSDSQLLVSQINGKYKILDEKIIPLFLKLWNLKIDFGKLSFRLISRDKNREADRLVNQALDKELRTKKLF